ncbi:glycosyltransferase family 2 protein [Lachnospiraceae bacterium ZAX-1]
MKFSIVVPCYNEEKNIPMILERFQANMVGNLEVVLVDNGSTDHTQEVIASLIPRYPFANTIRVSVNKGYGFGILAGLDFVDGDYIGWTHADMQTDPGDIRKAIQLVENTAGESLFVKGLRKNRPLSDRFFTMGMGIFESVYMGKPLWDINAQPNVFPMEFYKQWKNPPHDFSLDLYALYMAQKSGLGIKRFDVVFPPRIHGVSHWNTGLASKIKFIKRTIAFSIKLKKRGIE